MKKILFPSPGPTTIQYVLSQSSLKGVVVQLLPAIFTIITENKLIL